MMPMMSRRAALAQLLVLLARPLPAAARGASDEVQRDQALRTLRTTDARPPWLTSENWANRQYGPWTDYLAGRLSDAEFETVCAKPSDYCLRDIWNLRRSRAAPIDWDRQERFNWSGVHALSLRFFRTGEAIYLRKWLDVVGDFARWSLARAARADTPLARGEPQAVLDSAFAWGSIFTALGIIAKGLGPVEARSDRQRQGSPFEPNLDSIDADSLATVPAAELLAIARAMARGDGPWLARHYADPRYVPNQRCFGLEALACLAAFFPALDALDALRPQLQASLVDVMSRYRATDGGQLEQSFNYAQDVAHAAMRLTALAPTPTPPWVYEARATSQGWKRLIAALAVPGGGLPQLGNAAWGRFGRDGADARLAVASVAFPYSGLYAMRSGWDRDAAYAFFFVRRAARGHSMAGNLALQLAAFGRPLIVGGGSADYRPAGVGDARAKAFLSETSSWKCSTVLVDGLSQRGASVEGLALDAAGRPDITRAATAPIRSRWHHGDAFDLAEGDHETGYGSDGVTADGVPHRRQLVFLRPLACWIVVDTLIGRDRHRYTQVWNFAPPQGLANVQGFDTSQLTIRERGVHTIDRSPGAVNLSIDHLGIPSIRYTKAFGDDRYGWFAAGPLTPAVPALNLHVQWEGAGPQVLVTLLRPQRGEARALRQLEDRSGPDSARGNFTFDDGTVVAVEARTPAGGLREPQLMLALRLPGRPESTLVLHGETGWEQAGDGRRTDLGMPAGFRWQEEADGRLRPLYHNR